jgi:hypothetical protein
MFRRGAVVVAALLIGSTYGSTNAHRVLEEDVELPPTPAPSELPTPTPTAMPATGAPSLLPSSSPTSTFAPTPRPSLSAPSPLPSPAPSALPTSAPTLSRPPTKSPTASFAPSRSPTTSQPSVSVAPTVDVYLRYDTKCDNKNLRHKYRRIVTLLATLTIAMLIATFIMGGVTLFRTKCIVHCCRKQKTEAYNTWTDPHSYYGRAKTSFMAYLAKFDHPNQPPPRPRPAAGGAMAHRGDDRETML